MMSLQVQLAQNVPDKEKAALSYSKKTQNSSFATFLDDAVSDRQKAGEKSEVTQKKSEKSAVNKKASSEKPLAKARTQESKASGEKPSHVKAVKKEVLEDFTSKDVSFDENAFNKDFSSEVNLFSEGTAVLNENTDFLENSQISLKNSGELSLEQDFKELSEESAMVITSEALEYLKTASRSPSLDDLIDNAAEYVAKDTSDSLLQTAQNMAVEEPKEFLKAANLAAENSRASDIFEVSSLDEALRNISQNSRDEELPLEERNLSETDLKKTFTVTDLRSDSEKLSSAKETSKSLKVQPSSHGENRAELVLTLGNEKNPALELEGDSKVQGDSSFRTMLAREIQNNVPEFVKAGSLVLQDNNRGSINMILKPESLGNVKVSLEVSDKVITGHITVASKEAFEAFKDSIQNLKQAFEAAGYDDAHFNLSFDSSHQNQGFTQSQEGREQMMQMLSERAYSPYVSTGDEHEALRLIDYSSPGDYKVDVVA